MTERQQEKEIIKKRLRQLYGKNQQVRTAITEEVKTLNGVIGDGSSFGRLHDLLEKQAYRLSYWRVATEEINYRRFFDVNELVALRMEDPLVFEVTHRLLRELLLKGVVTGIRVDHVDGLFDPEEYLWRLQRAHWLDLSFRELERQPQFAQLDRTELEQQTSQFYERERQNNPHSTFVRPLYVIVEKILGEKEMLRETWPVDGTTGYEFTTALNQIFVDNRHERAMLDTYQRFTGANLTFQDVAYQCKNLVMRTSISAEVNQLAHQLNRVSERSWQYRDFTLNSLRDAIREVIACFPVYRTYINAYGESIDARDRATVDAAIREAKRRNPAVTPDIFDFVNDTLMLHYPTGMTEEGRDEQRQFVMRFQQFTGAIMAKGTEDTAFYIYNPLVSLNEVGGRPQRFGTSVEEFHRQNMERHQTMPHSLVSTSTHDSKRGEDVRARINVLSEIPKDWRSALRRWSRLNKNTKAMVNGETVPDRNEEYLLYQTLLGTYPAQETGQDELDTYTDRIQRYMLKAVREAKVHTSWMSPHTAYEEGVTKFVGDVLEPSPSNQFLADFRVLNQLVTTCGTYNSLSQTVLKIFSPGVPDIYQGNELWALNLTDPDNRRPVDFARRILFLSQLKEQMASSRDLAGLTQKLMETSHDGRVKLYVTWRSLNYRREHAELFADGAYVPLKAGGAEKDHVCAVAWQREKRVLIVIVPRLVAGLTRQTTLQPLGVQAWGDTHLALPRKLKDEKYQNIFTGETVSTLHQENRSELHLAQVLSTFPVAALESVIS